MKSWADCSSDEESLGDDEEVATALASTQLDDEKVRQEEQIRKEPEQEHDAESEVKEPSPVKKSYDFPSQPPYTAFVGNLAYSVDDGEKLKEALGDVIADRLGPGMVNVLEGRIATDRYSGKHRGFGYIEVETVDQLKLLMEINDGQSQIAGRNIQLDTASARNNNNNNNRRNNNRHSKGSFSSVDGSNFRGGRFSGSSSNDAPAQRASLKLAPRSKPREGDGNGSSSDIFGGAKARDEQAWEKRKVASGDDRQRSSQSKGRGGGGRGGKGRNGGGHRGDKGGDKSNNNKDKDKDSKNNKNNNSKNNNSKNNSNRRNSRPQEPSPNEGKQDKPAVSQPQPAKSAPPAAKKAPINKFALLMDSDSE